MGLLDRFMKPRKTELTQDRVVDMCINGKIKQKDIIYTRTINLLGAAQTLIDIGEAGKASILVGFMVLNNPSVLIGNFILKHPELDVPEAVRFKDRLDTEEEREVFYDLCREGRIPSLLNGGGIQEKIRPSSSGIVYRENTDIQNGTGGDGERDVSASWSSFHGAGAEELHEL